VLQSIDRQKRQCPLGRQTGAGIAAVRSPSVGWKPAAVPFCHPSRGFVGFCVHCLGSPHRSPDSVRVGTSQRWASLPDGRRWCSSTRRGWDPHCRCGILRAARAPARSTRKDSLPVRVSRGGPLPLSGSLIGALPLIFSAIHQDAPPLPTWSARSEARTVMVGTRSLPGARYAREDSACHLAHLHRVEDSSASRAPPQPLKAVLMEVVCRGRAPRSQQRSA
jgi:hypothetical protein